MVLKRKNKTTGLLLCGSFSAGLFVFHWVRSTAFVLYSARVSFRTLTYFRLPKCVCFLIKSILSCFYFILQMDSDIRDSSTGCR